jgi:hypothetical protein
MKKIIKKIIVLYFDILFLINNNIFIYIILYDKFIKKSTIITIYDFNNILYFIE